ncbi:MAG: cobyrinate a,c-diamide synthase [Dehalococcoidia bacterium]
MKVAIPRLVIAGTHSGVGKTTISIGVMAALKRRGLKVQPFKVGPDYIDPMYHLVATGLPSRNLDSWMVPPEAMVGLFDRAARRADISVVEGVMGLFDGHSGLDDAGSTAQVAKLIDSPVILIINVGAMARSAAAIALGYQRFDPELDLKGFIVNGVGGPRHFQWVKEAIEQTTSLPVLGYLPKNEADLKLPERHLGLVPTAEQGELVAFFDKLVSQIEETLDIDGLLRVAHSAGPLVPENSGLFPVEPVSPLVRIAVARDEAFSFYYQDNLDLLEAHGAELVHFSPLEDRVLPENIGGIYIGGGFPEMFADKLSRNQSFIADLRRLASEGMPIYAECGGLMYLCRGVTDFEGNRYPLAGLVPGWSAMTRKLSRMGYVEVEFGRDTVLATAGTRLRGHEFHWSELEEALPSPAYRMTHPHIANEGYAEGNLLASYVHLHFGTDPQLAPNFVRVCHRHQRGRNIFDK